MAKATAEQSHRISIFWLKKEGYLPIEGGWRWGSIRWTCGGEASGSIQYQIVLTYRPPKDFEHFTTEEKIEWADGISLIKRDSKIDEGEYIRLIYTHTDHWTEEKSDMDFKIMLATTPCNYGGVRYWFVCPLSKNGQYCGRRVGVLYNIGKWFGCRHCGDIAYASQMQGGRNKGFVSIPDIEQAEKEVKRWYYRGKPTRKYRRVIRLNEKFEKGFLELAGLVARVKKKFADFEK